MVETEEEAVVEAVEMDVVDETEATDIKTDVTEDVVAADADTMITTAVDEEAVDVDVKMEGMHQTLTYLAYQATSTLTTLLSLMISGMASTRSKETRSTHSGASGINNAKSIEWDATFMVTTLVKGMILAPWIPRHTNPLSDISMNSMSRVTDIHYHLQQMAKFPNPHRAAETVAPIAEEVQYQLRTQDLLSVDAVRID